MVPRLDRDENETWTFRPRMGWAAARRSAQRDHAVCAARIRGTDVPNAIQDLAAARIMQKHPPDGRR